MQSKLFDDGEVKKTYRAIRHDVVRKKQSENSNQVHHPDAKIRQVRKCLDNFCGLDEISILELFAGHGNLTIVYAEYGDVYANELK